MHKVKHGRIRKDIQCGMYEYLCEVEDKLSLMKNEPSFALILFDKMTRQIEKYKGTSLGFKFEAYQARLMSYFVNELWS